MTLEDFFNLMKKNNKTNSEIKNLIFSRIKQGDKRFSVDVSTRNIIILNDDFSDLIQG
jgi:hypothetical protein